MGLNLKLVRQSLVGEGASFGVGTDLGILYQANPKLAFGARLADITTTRLYWDTGRRETVSPTVTLGAHTTRQIEALQGSVSLGLDAAFAFEGQTGDQFDSGSSPATCSPERSTGSAARWPCAWGPTAAISPRGRGCATSRSAPTTPTCPTPSWKPPIG